MAKRKLELTIVFFCEVEYMVLFDVNREVGWVEVWIFEGLQISSDDVNKEMDRGSTRFHSGSIFLEPLFWV